MGIPSVATIVGTSVGTSVGTDVGTPSATEEEKDIVHLKVEITVNTEDKSTKYC